MPQKRILIGTPLKGDIPKSYFRTSLQMVTAEIPDVKLDWILLDGPAVQIARNEIAHYAVEQSVELEPEQVEQVQEVAEAALERAEEVVEAAEAVAIAEETEAAVEEVESDAEASVAEADEAERLDPDEVAALAAVGADFEDSAQQQEFP